MSPETYSFACPVCAVRLSVPRALAGVRGPCPLCHHEITAPVPELVLVPEMAVASSGAVMSSSPENQGDTVRVAAAPPPLVVSTVPDGVPPPLPLPEHESALDLPDVVVETTPSMEWDEPSARAEMTAEHPALPAAPAVRKSKWWVATAVMIALGLLVAAALNLLPRHSLQSWLRSLTATAAEAAAVAPEPRESSSVIQSTPPAAAEPPVAIAPASPAAEIREAASPMEIDAPVPDARIESSGSAVDSTAAGGNVSSTTDEPAPVSSESNAAEPAAVASAAIAPPPVPAPTRTGPASLLPDISASASPAGESTNEAHAGAQEALTLFLQAKTWKDRLALSHDGESHRAEMQAYYGKAKDGPNPPTSVEHIASAPLPDGRGTVQVFHVTFADLPQGFPVPVFQTDDGWKIDWQAFVEFRESRLKKFLAQYRDAPAVFRVRLQRAHYQDRSVPNLDQKYIFRVSAPIDGHDGYAFVDKNDSIVVPKLSENLQWDAIDHVMVKLKWVRGGSGRSYVELRDIESSSWRPAP